MYAASTTEKAAPQHLVALREANKIRLARAELKRRVTSGDREVAAIVLADARETETMPLSDLLMCQRRWGATRCRRFLQSIPMTENKTIGSMTERQRNAVAQLLREGTLEPTPATSGRPQLRTAYATA